MSKDNFELVYDSVRLRLLSLIKRNHSSSISDTPNFFGLKYYLLVVKKVINDLIVIV